MSKITTIGTISFYNGGETPGSTNPPTIVEFKAESLSDAPNDVSFSFSASDYKSISIFIQLLDGETEVGSLESFSVLGYTTYKITKDKNYLTKVYVTATNANGSTSSTPIILEKASPELGSVGDDFISSCLFIQPSSSFNKISIDLTLLKKDIYSLADIKSITLLSKREDFKTWNSVSLPISAANPESNNGKIINYKFQYNKIEFLRPSIGGFFSFKLKISINGFSDVYSEEKKFFYDNMSQQQLSANDSSSFPKAEITDGLASLRYEIDAKLYQIFTLKSNFRYDPVIDEEKENPVFAYGFLDSEDVAGLDYREHLNGTVNGQGLFYYEFNAKTTDGSTKGFMYPACVSEIYPYILPEIDSDGNKSIVFFWKINKNFYDYSYFKNNISVLTKSFKVKLQYKYNGDYTDLTSDISLLKDIHYQSSTDKFIIKIERDTDVIASVRHLFNSILDYDNASDNVRFVVTEHSVACSCAGEDMREYVFGKLLLPPKWTYIAYDKYIPKDSTSRVNNKVNINLSDLCVRGIKLPEKGFSSFDKIKNASAFYSSSGGRSTTIFDVSIAYKISCSFNGFYKDPIIEGTINSIVLPDIPDDVFLIPPKINLPAPNLVKSGEGSIQADAKVNIDEYGKIKSVEIIDPGGGYSLYKTQLDKRKQSFSDFTPAIITPYKVVASPIQYTKKSLTPINASFDSSNLKASLYKGVRLASVEEDAKMMAGDLTENEKKDLQEYISQSNVETDPEQVDIPPVYNETTKQESLLNNIFDDEWLAVSQLYEEKYNNPMDGASISNEDEDPAVSVVSDSNVQAAQTASEASSTPTSVAAGSSQTNQSGGQWSAFALNNLQVVPDGSPAVFNSFTKIAPPWLTILPISVRSDLERGYGPLPNMKTRAEMFNRIVAAINNLNEVRVIAPFVWLTQEQSSSESWAVPTDQDSLAEIQFSMGGTKIYNNFPPPVDEMVPINKSLMVGSTRSVVKQTLLAKELDPALGIPGGVYAVSSQYSSSLKFTPRIHPFMDNAIPPYIAKSLKKRILGLVGQRSYNCASSQTRISSTSGIPVIGCRFYGSDNDVERRFPSSYPDTVIQADTHFEFFDSGGSISAKPRGTSRYVGFQIQILDNKGRFCYASCDEGDSKYIDFTYANMYPATFKFQ